MARNCPGVELLQKEMLIYELVIRGESTDGNVPDLVTRLRRALGKPVNIHQQSTGEATTATLSYLQSAIDAISNTLSVIEQPTAKQLSRIRAQFSHLVNRINDCASGLGDEQQHKQALENLFQISDQLSQKLNTISMEGDPSKAEQGVTNMQSRELNLESNQQSLVTDFQSPAESVSTMRYASLPNPILYFLRGITELSLQSELTVKTVLWLLVELQEHAQTLNISHQTIFSVIYPLATGRLRELISHALITKQRIDTFRQHLLQTEISFHLQRQIETKYLWRVQDLNEPLSQYLNRVKLTYLALRPDISEQQAVANIVDAMCPQFRNQILIMGRPTSLNQLSLHVNELLKLNFVDEQRKQQCISPVRVQSHNRSIPKCFRCGSLDHLVRQCPVQRQSRPDK